MAANARSFYYHYGQTARKDPKINKVLVPLRAELPGLGTAATPCQPCRAPLRKVQYTPASNLHPSNLILPPSIATMLFGLGNLFYGTSPVFFPRTTYLWPKLTSVLQYRSSSSTPSPYYRRTGSSRAVRLSPCTERYSRIGIFFLISLAVGWGNTPTEPSFGGSNDAASVKGKLVNLISSVRTLMRSELSPHIRFVSGTRGDVVGYTGYVCFMSWKSVHGRSSRKSVVGP